MKKNGKRLKGTLLLCAAAAAVFLPVSAQVVEGAAVNTAPIAENLDFSTYRNVAITQRFSAMDPEGDALTFRLETMPARGSVSIAEDGTFTYTPYENKVGKDSFTYVAIDSAGGVSQPATVKLRITKANTKVTYADLDGNAAHRAALRLAEEGIFEGERIGQTCFFRPEATVSRSEFTAMAMKAVGLDTLEGIGVTGFADDAAIDAWAKPYVSAALKAGKVTGYPDADGRMVFGPDEPITRAESAVLLNRLLSISDVAVETFYADGEAAPAWAYQSAVNLETAGILDTDLTGALCLNQELTRADAAVMLSGALDLLGNRRSGAGF